MALAASVTFIALARATIILGVAGLILGRIMQVASSRLNVYIINDFNLLVSLVPTTEDPKR